MANRLRSCVSRGLVGHVPGFNFLFPQRIVIARSVEIDDIPLSAALSANFHRVC